MSGIGGGLRRWRSVDLWWLGTSGLVVLGWDVSGADLALSTWAGGAQAFPLRAHWVTARLLHDRGRAAAAVALCVLAVSALPAAPALRAASPGHSAGPARREHLGWLAVVLAALGLVPLLKRASHTSCPWDLLPFGGTVPYVGHWVAGVIDGGPGHCFPSGHAVAAFAFLGTGFLWRPWRPRLARAVFVAVALAGSLFAVAQLLRGAHFLSHSLWSAWLCLALAVAAEPWLRPASP